MELNHKTFGAGDPVIILHGLFGTLDNWQTVAKKLAGFNLQMSRNCLLIYKRALLVKNDCCVIFLALC